MALLTIYILKIEYLISFPFLRIFKVNIYTLRLIYFVDVVVLLIFKVIFLFFKLILDELRYHVLSQFYYLVNHAKVVINKFRLCLHVLNLINVEASL